MKENKFDIKTTPKRLILSLLSSPGIREIDVIYLIEWGKIFNIDPPTTRVAVGRLVKQGLISSISRGKYTIGPNARMMAKTASSWGDAEDKIGSWSGKWIVAHTGHLGRTNKTAVRSRERSFRLNGFSSLVTGLWCRPGNLKESTQQTKDRLTLMGLEQQAIVMNCDEFSGMEIDALCLLWPIGEIESGYHHAINVMLQSIAKLDTLDVRDAVRETFLVGESVIKQINADPLLPDEMIDTKLRREMVNQMKQYNELGRAVWEQFHASFKT